MDIFEQKLFKIVQSKFMHNREKELSKILSKILHTQITAEININYNKTYKEINSIGFITFPQINGDNTRVLIYKNNVIKNDILQYFNIIPELRQVLIIFRKIHYYVISHMFQNPTKLHIHQIKCNKCKYRFFCKINKPLLNHIVYLGTPESQMRHYKKTICSNINFIKTPIQYK